MPSAVVGGAERRKSARNCTPCVRSLTHRPLACTNSPAPMRRRVADDRDQIAMAACLYPQYAEAAVLVVVGDALDQAGEVLALRNSG